MSGETPDNMRGIGSKTKCLGSALSNGMTEDNIKAFFLMTSDMEKE